MFVRNIDPAFPRRLFDALDLNSRLSDMIMPSANPLEYELALVYVLTGLFNTVGTWLNTENRMSAHELSALLVRLSTNGWAALD